MGDEFVADSRVSFAPGETVQMGLVPVYVYCGVPWTSFMDMSEKFGYVMEISISSRNSQASAVSCDKRMSDPR